MKVAVSFISSLEDESKTIKLIDKSQADYIHIDIMDGIFVPVKNYDYKQIREWVSGIDKPLDIHLMVKEPLNIIKEYSKLKPFYITFHQEATKYPMTIINYLKEHHIKVGMAINPETSIDNIKPYLKYIDLVLIMSVEPGYGGQKFLPEVLNKVNKLKALQANYNFKISIDGGINDETIKQVNTDIVVSGSYICKSLNYNEQINKLLTSK